jgi:phosphoribosylglycinamide formyltransferase-1
VSGRRIGVLISGRGTNLQAMIDAIAEGRLRAEIAVVISNIWNAAGLEKARAVNIPTLVMPHQDSPSRTAYDRALADALRARNVDLVCLAGFMRLLGTTFIDAFPNRILNIHPSLLPAFPGLDAQRQALHHGVKVTGATVHFVDAALDAGPIVVLPGDTVASLSARILVEEHRLYPEAIDRVLNGGWRIDGRRMVDTAAATS